MHLINIIAGFVVGTWLARLIFGVRWLHFEYGIIQTLHMPFWLYEGLKACVCLFWLYAMYRNNKRKRKYILPKL